MITDRQWNIFAQYVKPNATIELTMLELTPNQTGVWRNVKVEGFLIENFPYGEDLQRIEDEAYHILRFGYKWMNKDGGVDISSETGPMLRIQLCTEPDEMLRPPYELRYWVKGEFLEFDEVLALGGMK